MAGTYLVGASLFLGIMLLVAGGLKTFQSAFFAAAIERLVDRTRIQGMAARSRAVARTVGLTEIAVGSTIILADGQLALVGSIVASTLGAGFLVATLAAAKRGVGCGCFGPKSLHSAGGAEITRAALFAVVAITTLGLNVAGAPRTTLSLSAALGVSAVLTVATVIAMFIASSLARDSSAPQVTPVPLNDRGSDFTRAVRSRRSFLRFAGIAAAGVFGVTTGALGMPLGSPWTRRALADGRPSGLPIGDSEAGEPQDIEVTTRPLTESEIATLIAEAERNPLMRMALVTLAVAGYSLDLASASGGLRSVTGLPIHDQPLRFLVVPIVGYTGDGEATLLFGDEPSDSGTLVYFIGDTIHQVTESGVASTAVDSPDAPRFANCWTSGVSCMLSIAGAVLACAGCVTVVGCIGCAIGVGSVTLSCKQYIDDCAPCLLATCRQTTSCVYTGFPFMWYTTVCVTCTAQGEVCTRQCWSVQGYLCQ